MTTNSNERKIIHVDMDAFYAQVEKLDNPKLKNSPVIVGGLGNRGVVSTASYEARKYGVHSAQPMAKARALCPQATFLSPRFERYKEISQQIRDIFHQYTPLIEPISLDEAFLDLSAHHRTAVKIGEEIKDKIYHRTKLTSSVGIGPNKFLAKLCSDWDKPDGFTVITEEEVSDFLKDMEVSKIWGVGKVTEKKLKGLGVDTIDDLRQISKKELKRLFGKQGITLFQLARGIDDRPVQPESEPKSISKETTFERDIYDISKIKRTLLQLSEGVSRGLRDKQLLGKTVKLKARYPDFTTITRQITLRNPTDSTEIIYGKALALFKTHINPRKRGIRLLGVGISNLLDPNKRSVGHQLKLFTPKREKQLSKLEKVVEKIRDKYGEDAIKRGG